MRLSCFFFFEILYNQNNLKGVKYVIRNVTIHILPVLRLEVWAIYGSSHFLTTYYSTKSSLKNVLPGGLMPVSHEEWDWNANEKRWYFGENKENSCKIKRMLCTQNAYILHTFAHILRLVCKQFVCNFTQSLKTAISLGRVRNAIDGTKQSQTDL